MRPLSGQWIFSVLVRAPNSHSPYELSMCISSVEFKGFKFLLYRLFSLIMVAVVIYSEYIGDEQKLTTRWREPFVSEEITLACCRAFAHDFI